MNYVERECQFCIDRECECSENCTRRHGCMEFRPDMAIPEVAEIERNNTSQSN